VRSSSILLFDVRKVAQDRLKKEREKSFSSAARSGFWREPPSLSCRLARQFLTSLVSSRPIIGGFLDDKFRRVISWTGIALVGASKSAVLLDDGRKDIVLVRPRSQGSVDEGRQSCPQLCTPTVVHFTSSVFQRMVSSAMIRQNAVG